MLESCLSKGGAAGIAGGCVIPRLDNSLALLSTWRSSASFLAPLIAADPAGAEEGEARECAAKIAVYIFIVVLFPVLVDRASSQVACGIATTT